ncbi:hypothetical protein ACE1SV_07210 [Streptomyces sp. E-15]
MVGTCVFDPFGMVMFAPIVCRLPGCVRGPDRPGPGRPCPDNLFPGAARPRERHGKTGGGPPATREEPGLYTIQTMTDVPFCQLRSDWVSQAAVDTENNPLIGLPNQHIVGLTYVP